MRVGYSPQYIYYELLVKYHRSVVTQKTFAKTLYYVCSSGSCGFTHLSHSTGSSHIVINCCIIYSQSCIANCLHGLT